jgi:hypothetical protein
MDICNVDCNLINMYISNVDCKLINMYICNVDIIDVRIKFSLIGDLS